MSGDKTRRDQLIDAGRDAGAHFGPDPVGQFLQLCPPEAKKKIAIRFIKPSDARGSFVPTGTEPAARELEFGFWDNAYQLFSVAHPGGAVGTTLNGEEKEPDNLVGGDSRRFHLVVEDHCAAGQPYIEADWWTANQQSDARQPGTVSDDPGSKLTLLETKPGSGLFVSKGLMLVDDAVDRSIAVHSGIAPSHPLLGKAHGGLRTDTMSNYRLRRAGMFGFGVASYRSKALGASVTALAPVFLPSSRRLLPLQVYVVRKQKGAELAARDLRVITETYERHGIWLFTTVSPADLNVPGVSVEKAGTPVEYTMLSVDPPITSGSASVNLSGINMLAKTFPAMPNTARLFFVENLLYRVDGQGMFGLTFTRSYEPPPADGVKQMYTVRAVPPTTFGASFVQVDRSPYSAAHEIGHIVMDKTPNEGHYEQPHEFSKPGERHAAKLDLMSPFEAVRAEQPLDAKRIWDQPDGDGFDQHLSLMLSPFLR